MTTESHSFAYSPVEHVIEVRPMSRFSTKRLVASVVLAALIGLIGQYFYLGEVAEAYGQNLPGVGPLIEKLPQSLRQALFHQYPGFALSIVTIPIIWPILAAGPGRSLLDLIIPDPPPFLETQLERESAKETSPFSSRIHSPDDVLNWNAYLSSLEGAHSSSGGLSTDLPELARHGWLSNG